MHAIVMVLGMDGVLTRMRLSEARDIGVSGV